VKIRATGPLRREVHNSRVDAFDPNMRSNLSARTLRRLDRKLKKRKVKKHERIR
jgi:hypothetical protein